MAISNDNIRGGTNWSKEAFNHDDVNDTFDAVGGILPPIGAVISWLKSYTNTPATLPDGWVECSGQTLSDADSVYNGQTIPDLNGDNRFMRGNSTSGGVGGEESHTLTTAELPSHTHTYALSSGDGGGGLGGGTPFDTNTTTNTGSTGSGDAHENRPPFYDVVWIMRVK